MDTKQLKDAIVKVLQDKNGLDIRVVDLDGRTIIADFFIIATGSSTPHLRALAEYIESGLEKDGIRPLRKEGLREGGWIVLDYGSIIVHLFNRESRDYCCLEKLWGSEDNTALQE